MRNFVETKIYGKGIDLYIEKEKPHTIVCG
ncbi:hypothetical protein G159_19895 [Planococcus glaciei CHR43]|nr:hypothetical protein G159_19895 [Planococcus glaciei CHR43]